MSVCPSIFNPASQVQGCGVLAPIPDDFGGKADDTLKWSPDSFAYQ